MPAYRSILLHGVLATLTLAASASTAHAIITLAGQVGPVPGESHECPRPVQHDCVIEVKPLVLLDGPSQGCSQAMQEFFGSWQPAYNYAQPWAGTLTIDTFQVWAAGGATHTPGCSMGVELKCHYDPARDDDIFRMRWLQVIKTNAEVKKGSPVNHWYVDPWGNPPEDNLPFYFKEGEWLRPPFNLPNEWWFFDEPTRECPCLGFVDWTAELYLVNWSSPPGMEDRGLFIHQGVSWGFTITCEAPEGWSAIPEAATAGHILAILLVLVATCLGRRRPCR